MRVYSISAATMARIVFSSCRRRQKEVVGVVLLIDVVDVVLLKFGVKLTGAQKTEVRPGWLDGALLHDSCRRAAIHLDRRAGDEARLVRGEEHGQASDV